MKHLVSVLVFTGLCISATHAAAQATAAAAPKTVAQVGQSSPQPRANAGSPDEVICKHEIEETGSRIAPHMLCGTRAEWAERLREDRSKVEQIQIGSLQH